MVTPAEEGSITLLRNKECIYANGQEVERVAHQDALIEPVVLHEHLALRPPDEDVLHHSVHFCCEGIVLGTVWRTSGLVGEYDDWVEIAHDVDSGHKKAAVDTAAPSAQRERLVLTHEQLRVASRRCATCEIHAEVPIHAIAFETTIPLKEHLPASYTSQPDAVSMLISYL